MKKIEIALSFCKSLHVTKLNCEKLVEADIAFMKIDQLYVQTICLHPVLIGKVKGWSVASIFGFNQGWSTASASSLCSASEET